MSTVWESFPHTSSNYSNQIFSSVSLFEASLSNVTCIFEQNFVHVGAGVLEQFVVGVEDDNGDLAVTEDGELVGLLHQTKLAFCERHLAGIN